MRKIQTRLPGTNFCTSSARFAPSFVRQPNGPGCTQIVRHAPKCQFRVQWGESGAFVAKNSNTTSWHELLHYCTSSARFEPSFIRKQNGPKCTQRVRNTPKHEFRGQWGGSGAFITKNSDATLWHELLQPNGPRCTQIVRHAPKCQLRVQWDGSGVFVAKIPTRQPGTNFGTSSARFSPSFIRQPSGPKCTRIVRNAPKCHFRV